MKPGRLNLITDVPGLLVGHASDNHIKTGVTVLTADKPFVAAVDVMGGAPGTRETALLAPDKSVQAVDALVLSGGSAFGLDAASGVVDTLAKRGRGFAVGPAIVPIVPAAILFDLINGGDKNWPENPYRTLGVDALNAALPDFLLGSVGAGTGATSAGLKGGLGSASLVLENGISVGALVAANPTGQVVSDGDGHFWAGALEQNAEFGGMGPSLQPVNLATSGRTKQDFARGGTRGEGLGEAGSNTTLAIVATDAKLTRAEAKRLAVAAHDGMARAIFPSHTPVDGDLVFCVSTGERAMADPLMDLAALGHAASICLARAIARGVYEATPARDDVFPTWQAEFGHKAR